MNQNQIQQLTSHLSQALDQNYDVVNMEAVLSVICALEGTTITKEQLEATRLAKYINQLRRRTKNDQLARRAKSLLKKWREMVGIHQQTTNDSQPQPLAPSSFKPIVGTNLPETESTTAEVVVNSPQYTSQSSPPSSQRVNSDLHSNVDSSEPHHINFSSLINNNINTDNRDDSLAIINKSIKHPRTIESKSQKSATFINEHSSNSVSSVMVANEKLNEASIVIDIVSDSDENDSQSQPVNNYQKLATASSSLALPAVYPRPKKLKKDKKRKERDGRDKQSQFNFNDGVPQQFINANRSNLNRIPVKEGRMPKTNPTDPEILSLSNSSMSSILSGDAFSGNSQSRPRTTAADLTFAGRFNSVTRPDTSNYVNSVQANGQKKINQVSEPSSLDLTIPQMYDDYINNDSSTSCSRLSPYEELEAKPGQNNSKTFAEATPKKRGRKKGSKGVDSLIAKESSLSQQIFFGSGVKKVKTTKELFNDMQSRKLSISFNRGDSLPAVANKITNTTTLRNLESRSLIARPTSSCSETSIHSPHTLEAYSTNVSQAGTEKLSNILEEPGNTDSDTITSEPSRDSMKSRGIKRMNSLDSNSNSLQTTSVKNAEVLTSSKDYNDVTTQLMHIVRSLNSPLSVNETEKLYQAQIVPCTCIVVEDIPKEPSAQNNIGHSDMEADSVNTATCDIETVRDKKHNEQPSLKTDNSDVEEAPLSISQKPMKSIFDLDFDDDDDPLQSIIKNISPPESNLKQDPDNDYIKSSNTVSSFTEENNKDLKAVTDSYLDQEASNIVLEPISVYTVHEDPDCVAKKRFDVQTNDVTNFHINALHNYYIPNINGNWNSIDSSIVLTTTITKFLQTLESYTVSDGADVVPKYGSLTYERIRKDLSYLKFDRNWKSKSFKSFIPPFLGVAKCLPTCRLAAKRLKDKTKTLSTVKSFDTIVKLEEPEVNFNYFENSKGSPSPLRVEVDAVDGNSGENQFQARSSDDGPLMNNNATLSFNLLKLVNNDEGRESVADDQLNSEPTIDGFDNRKGIRCRSDSSCSNSSLQLTQDSINEKLRNQRILSLTSEKSQSERNVERNRKKRRKARHAESNDGKDLGNNKQIANTSIDEKPHIKRIKIAINGNVATQRQISRISSSNNSSDDEHEDEVDGETRSEVSDPEGGYDTSGYSQKGQAASDDEQESYRSHSTTIDSIAADDDGHLENEYENSNDEEYAIVQRPMVGVGSNHIVLTIKKTPSKINSPVNSISAISPNVGQASACVAGTLEAQTAAKNAHFTTTNTDSNIEYPETEIISEYERKFSLEPKAFRTDELPDRPSLTSHACHNNLNTCYRYCRRRRRLRYRRSRHLICPKETIDIELNHLFNNVTRSTQRLVKTHRKLFFANELCRQDGAGRKERIVNYSSSSSSSSCTSNDEDDSDPEEKSKRKRKRNSAWSEDTEKCQIAFSKKYKLKNETDPNIDQEDLYLYSDSDESFNTGEFGNQHDELNDIKLNTQDELPLHNNGMLPSFNFINNDHQLKPSADEVNEKAIEEPSLELLQIQNCDDVNVCYNNNNISVIKSHSLGSVMPINDDNGNECVIDNLTSQALERTEKCNQIYTEVSSELMLSQPAIEYRTGIRAVVDDAPSKCGVDTTQIQQFKEWHEVLQLQSYNNEPLIVLPYVVLE
ncbi:mediator of RNA polymerase II transcription subunit 26 [Drosophila montana]|uniref:mediator of RNA polymerase II transcription subunit 26 n=1 Tax=Drosophila montana TaxID=40370 RepID=UPI00313E99F6